MNIDKFDPQELIGMTEAEARAYCKEHGVMCRVTFVEGQRIVSTMEYRPDRINLKVDAAGNIFQITRG